jgi:hypothetical protein
MTDTSEVPPPPRKRWSVGRPFAEVILIALGVFLGLAGEQWRDRAERNERAAETLRRIRAELAANRDEVNRVVDYHATSHRQLKDFLAATAAKRRESPFRLEGIQPAQFETTAWQLAQATQALVDFDPGLSFALARVYGVQARYQGLTEGITDAMYLRPPSEDTLPFLHSLTLYYSDITELEPALARLYDEVLPQIDRELGR